MNKKLILMNQNTEVLEFEFDEELNSIIKINKLNNIEFSPINIKNVSHEKRLKEFNNWFEERAIPIYRDDITNLNEALGINNVKELINKNYALSVSDQYWFKPKFESKNKDDKDCIKWSDINYFDNDYNSLLFENATFGSSTKKSLKNNIINKSKDNTTNGSIKNIINEEQNKTPNNTTNGQLKKVWIKYNNKNYLYKGAGTIHNFEPINEVLASKICKILEVPYVNYNIDIVKSKRQDNLVSICECAINKNEEIIPAHSILTEKQEEITKTINDYYIYLDILNLHQVPKAEEYLQKMFMLDYIMLNEDRHLSNFGVIRDVQTLKWTRICPIFDTGRSMNTNVTYKYWNFKESEVKCFTKELISCKNLEQLFTIKITKEQLENLQKLSKDYEKMLLKYKEYTKLKTEEIEKLVNGYKMRIKCFSKVVETEE